MFKKPPARPEFEDPVDKSLVVSRIRPLVLCLFSNSGRILVNEAHDPVKGLTFCRPVGGGIEFGETGLQAIQREVNEELGQGMHQVRYLGMLENLFTYLGEPGHEIVLVFDARFDDHSLYERPYLVGRESDGAEFRATWRELSSFGEGLPLFPDGLAALVHENIRRAHA